jgi:ABC-2 type transport system ATP-binding protein
MIAGVHLPDEGELSVCGLDVRRSGARVRELVGYLPESAPLHPELTVREALAFRAGLAGLAPARARAAIDEAMQRTDVARFSQRCCGALSKGMQQRVGLAAAILSDPRVLILDEPSVGLDPEQVLAFRELVRSLGAARLVLFSSHLLSEVECLAGELLVIAHGRVAAHESLEAFRGRALASSASAQSFARGGVVVETEAALPALGEVDTRFSARESEVLSDGWHRTTLRVQDGDHGAAREALARTLVARGIVARTLRSEDGGLEGVFVELVRAAAREGEVGR